MGSISAERVYPGVRISAAGALPISHWLDELEAAGHIARSGRHISLPDRERMRRAFGLS